MIRETEVLVYAVGIDGNSDTTFGGGRSTPPVVRQPHRGCPSRSPAAADAAADAAARGRAAAIPGVAACGGRDGGGAGNDDRVNAAALREITDDSGGRTEIVRTARDLDPATENIADELSKQYHLGYPAPGHHDGRWHTIRVEVNRPGYVVRARRGYTATK